MEENETYDHLALLTRKAQSKAGKRYHYGHTLDIKLITNQNGTNQDCYRGWCSHRNKFCYPNLVLLYVYYSYVITSGPREFPRPPTILALSDI